MYSNLFQHATDADTTHTHTNNYTLPPFVDALDDLLHDPEYLIINYFLKYEELHAYGLDKFLAEINVYEYDLDHLESIREDAESELESQMDVINESIAKEKLIETLQSAYEQERKKALAALKERIKALLPKDCVESLLEVF